MCNKMKMQYNNCIKIKMNVEKIFFLIFKMIKYTEEQIKERDISKKSTKKEIIIIKGIFVSRNSVFIGIFFSLLSSNILCGERSYENISFNLIFYFARENIFCFKHMLLLPFCQQS